MSRFGSPSQRGVALAVATLATLSFAVLALAARADLRAIADEKQDAERTQIARYNIEFVQRSRARQRALEGCGGEPEGLGSPRLVAASEEYARCRTAAQAGAPRLPDYVAFRTGRTATELAYDAQWEARRTLWLAAAGFVVLLVCGAGVVAVRAGASR